MNIMAIVLIIYMISAMIMGISFLFIDYVEIKIGDMSVFLPIFNTIISIMFIIYVVYILIEKIYSLKEVIKNILKQYKL